MDSRYFRGDIQIGFADGDERAAKEVRLDGSGCLTVVFPNGTVNVFAPGYWVKFRTRSTK